uniref:Glycylpeptide N-tetradecanoyltransferase n=1 Tax=Junco hyemalis TaxID=40217 RepID=A0A8C5ISD9_JUNHY
MADDSETAVRRPPARPSRPATEENDHEHCSDCENEAEHGSNRGGLSPANDSGAKKKKKKPKRKKEKGGGDQADQAQDQPVKVNSLPAERIQEIQKAIELFSVGQGPAKTMEEASKRSYQFWDTQPVPKLGMCSRSVSCGPWGRPCGPQEQGHGCTWCPSAVLKELYTLLNENYVEDDDNMFRFDYSPEFLLWALRPPGWLPQWHCGVRVVSSKKLVGFISAIPATIHIYDTEKKMVEINFLCVHKKLRSKRVAPVLIREITRRVHLEGIFQAVYTAGVVLPKPVGTCRYWHRSLNPRKLIEVKFSHLSRNMTMQRTTKLYRLPETPKTPGLRPMEHKDIPAVHKLLTEYLKQFHLTPVMSREEVEHWFVPQENIIDTFVVEVRAAAPWEGCSPGLLSLLELWEPPGSSSMALQGGNWLQYGVYGAQCPVPGAECGVPSAQCLVLSVECGVYSAWCSVLSMDVGCLVPSARCGVWGARCPALSVECGVYSARCSVLSMDVGCLVPSAECECPVPSAR